ncbi:unnamed protein product [Protopolystoma xenopodis]|uniref:Uncharacterized protein n=1 Tax=Protopolystoma xenopodis TaxID=117903 RepID=A0A3S5CS90_9PLAT|nr:unnamed protein product [Protopolystoma xenopodis]
MAAKRGHAKAARALLQVAGTGDNFVNAVGRNGLTPLHIATHYNHLPVVKLLLERGAEVDRKV